MNLTQKQAFSGVGMGLFVFVIVTIALQTVVSAVVSALQLDLSNANWLVWVLNFAPMYAIGLPVCLACMKRVPAEAPVEGEDMTAGRFIKLMTVCFTIMFVGNIIGTMLSGLLSGGTAENPLLSLTAQPGILGALVLVVIGPAVEELVFRKAILGRLTKYGEMTAILWSAVAFALFHMNLFQFFYAFGLGLIFGYVYVRTGKLFWSFLLHMIVNLMGSIVAPAAASAAEVNEEGAIVFGPGSLFFVVYMVVYLGLVIAGLVVFLRHRKEVRLVPAETPVGKDAWVNPGFLCFAIACLVMVVLSLVMGLIA